LPEDNCAEGEQAFMLVVNASNIEKDWNWIKKHNTLNVQMTDISDKTGLLAVQGPKAVEALQSLTDIDLNSIKYYTFRKASFAGIENTIISATGYTGSGGFELYVPNENLVQLWNAIFEAGKSFGIQPIGLGARDTLRLEMGFCLYGNDIDDTTSPLEAGLGWITKLNKGEFTDSEYLKSQKVEGVTRKLVAFTLEDRRVPRHGYKIENASGNEIGVVTSGTQSPSLGYPIGMGYVEVASSKLGSEIFIVISGKKLPATVTKLPFYKA
jgi:aminomethyltransferase